MNSKREDQLAIRESPKHKFILLKRHTEESKQIQSSLNINLPQSNQSSDKKPRFISPPQSFLSALKDNSKLENSASSKGKMQSLTRDQRRILMTLQRKRSQPGRRRSPNCSDESSPLSSSNQTQIIQAELPFNLPPNKKQTNNISSTSRPSHSRKQPSLKQVSEQTQNRIVVKTQSMFQTPFSNKATVIEIPKQFDDHRPGNNQEQTTEETKISAFNKVQQKLIQEIVLDEPLARKSRPTSSQELQFQHSIGLSTPKNQTFQGSSTDNKNNLKLPEKTSEQLGKSVQQEQFDMARSCIKESNLNVLNQFTKGKQDSNLLKDNNQGKFQGKQRKKKPFQESEFPTSLSFTNCFLLRIG